MSVIPFPEDEYLLALGRLAYSVAYLEWSILGDLSQLQNLPPELDLAGLVGESSGTLGDRLGAKKTLAKISDPAIVKWLTKGSAHLKKLAKKRNSILHARPATINGKQRLNRWDPKRSEIFAVEIDRIDELSDDILNAVQDVNRCRVVKPS